MNANDLYASRTRRLYEPCIYHTMFRYRDFAKECDGLLRIVGSYSRNRSSAAAEICCGPGYHARELATRGLSVSSIDGSQPMLDFAAALDRERGVAINYILANMSSYRLENPADFVFCILDSMSDLLNDKEAVAFFRSTAESLVPGGLLILQLTHPNDILRIDGRANEEVWSGQVDEGLLSTELHTIVEDQMSPARFRNETWRVSIQGCDTKVEFEETFRKRIWYVEDIEQCCVESGSLQPVCYLGSLIADEPYTPDSRFLVAVIRKP